MDRVLEIHKRLEEASDFIPLEYTVRQSSISNMPATKGETLYQHRLHDANGFQIETSGMWALKTDSLNELLAKAPCDLEYLLEELHKSRADRDQLAQRVQSAEMALDLISKWEQEQTDRAADMEHDPECWAPCIGATEELRGILQDSGIEVDRG